MRRQDLHPRTAMINKKQKNQAKEARYTALKWLATTFPQAFDNTLCIRPLKIGIMADILDYAKSLPNLPVSNSKIREAVVLFTRRIDYLICLKAREMRIDLAGIAIVALTEVDAEKAALKIKKRLEQTIRKAENKVLNYPTKSNPDKRITHTSNRSSIYYDNNANSDYTERLPLFSMQHISPKPARTTQVIVKHKITRQFDPDAVAKLKERLGLSRKNDTQKEVAE